MKALEASGTLEIEDAEESNIAMNRKVMDNNRNEELAGSQARKAEVINKNETEKGAASESKGVLRSNSAKKGDEEGKEVVREYAKAK